MKALILSSLYSDLLAKLSSMLSGIYRFQSSIWWSFCQQEVWTVIFKCFLLELQRCWPNHLDFSSLERFNVPKIKTYLDLYFSFEIQWLCRAQYTALWIHFNLFTHSNCSWLPSHDHYFFSHHSTSILLTTLPLECYVYPIWWLYDCPQLQGWLDTTCDIWEGYSVVITPAWGVPLAPVAPLPLFDPS